ncbi:MAG: coproporphyrinogen III oxidase family protein [Chloroflexi bacterium]|nr:coproporphyrinogen III oxidase family protein [Chloroflexota bacterium]
MTLVAAPPVALYAHVPFCVSLCPYCDFVVNAGAAARGPRARVEAYVAALLAEVDLRADALDARWGPPGGAVPDAAPAGPPPPDAAPAAGAHRPALASVYVGGGTPSLLPAASVSAILERVRARLGLAPGAEVTLEVNPGPDERGDLAGFVAAGVTRASIGAQSLVPSELRRLGRRHAPADVSATVTAARAAGIASISLDLLYDVPGQTPTSWDATLRGALDLGPDHLSLYALTLDDPDAEGLTGPLGDHLPTPSGARRWRAAALPEQDEDAAAAAYERACDALDAAGFRRYEISNWARPGHESRHNLVYWERRPYEAVGTGAHAFDGHTRRWSAAALEPYLATLAPPHGSGLAPALPPGGFEELDALTATAEETILGLRTDRGVPAPAAEAHPAAAALAWAVAEGLAEAGADGRIRLTRRGALLSNEVFARIV